MKRAGADVTERFQLWTGIGEQRCAAFPYADLCWCWLQRSKNDQFRGLKVIHSQD
jgi:hypothetical protein